MPSSGLESFVMNSMKTGLCRSGETASLMAVMPNIRTAKPIRISPTCRRDCVLENIRRTIPTREMMPVSVAVEKSSVQPPPVPPISDRQSTQPVMLVPRMAPMTMLMACRTFIIPELTKPTTMTDVAEEDWMTAVTPVPSRKPLSGVPVRRYKTTSSLLPATFFNPSPISAMPNRNSATPLSSEITLLMLISKFLHTTGGILSIMAQNS